MSTLDATALLQVWERGQNSTAPEKALLLLSAAWPDNPESALGELAVGERDGRLLALRERLFGQSMIGIIPCPACAESLELPLNTRQFALQEPATRESVLECDGFSIRFRIPTGMDLVACAATHEVAQGERELMQRCVLNAQRHGSFVQTESLSTELISALSQAMEEADPGADLQLDVDCPNCQHHWQTTFDIVSFLWTELQDWAIRILREVHILASVYGWSEDDILQLSPWRRRLYLQMVRP